VNHLLPDVKLLPRCGPRAEDLTHENSFPAVFRPLTAREIHQYQVQKTDLTLTCPFREQSGNKTDAPSNTMPADSPAQPRSGSCAHSAPLSA
jgi:hypothetical protein